MFYEKLRVYEGGRFFDVDLPDWYLEAERLSQNECMDCHRAFEQVLDCEYRPLTEEGMVSSGLEIRAWPSDRCGVFVVIETPLVLVEQILVPQPADWLAFLSTYLAPLMTASSQSAQVAVQSKMADAFISWARHGDGSHIDRETGLSRIDMENDRRRRLGERARAPQAQAGKGDAA